MGLLYQIVLVVLIISEFYPWLVLTASLVPINKCPGSHLSNRLHVPPAAVNTNEPLTFRLRNEFKTCKYEHTVTATLSVPAVSSWTKEVGQVGLKSRLSSHFTADGQFRHGMEYYYPEEYCISELLDGRVKATVCKPSCTRNRPCIRKCCPVGEVVDMEVAGCRPAGGKKWAPVLYSNATHMLTHEENSRVRPHFINSPPNCKYANGSMSEEYSSIPLRSLRVNEFQLETIPMRLLKNGTLIYFAITDTWEAIPKDLFCIDGMQNFGDVKSYTGLPSDQIVFSCVDYYNSNMRR